MRPFAAFAILLAPMTLVSLDKIVRRFGDFPVLDGLSLRVDEGDRIGVVGDNGAGKTTMIRILAGVDDADLGQRNPKNGLRIAYGAQMPAMPQGTMWPNMAMSGSTLRPKPWSVLPLATFTPMAHTLRGDIVRWSTQTPG